MELWVAAVPAVSGGPRLRHGPALGGGHLDGGVPRQVPAPEPGHDGQVLLCCFVFVVSLVVVFFVVESCFVGCCVLSFCWGGGGGRGGVGIQGPTKSDASCLVRGALEAAQSGKWCFSAAEVSSALNRRHSGESNGFVVLSQALQSRAMGQPEDASAVSSAGPGTRNRNPQLLAGPRFFNTAFLLEKQHIRRHRR